MVVISTYISIVNDYVCHLPQCALPFDATVSFLLRICISIIRVDEAAAASVLLTLLSSTDSILLVGFCVCRDNECIQHSTSIHTHAHTFTAHAHIHAHDIHIFLSAYDKHVCVHTYVHRIACIIVFRYVFMHVCIYILKFPIDILQMCVTKEMFLVTQNFLKFVKHK